MARGGEWFSTEDGETFWWPRCAVEGCPNFICFGHSDRHCYVHAANDPAVKAIFRRALERTDDKESNRGGARVESRETEGH